MGEHSDWAGSYRRFNKSIEPGLCLASGTNQGLFARVWPHPSKLVVSSVDHLGNVVGPQEFSMEPALLASVAAEGGHFAYVCGVAYQIAIRYHVRGLRIDNYRTDLPVQKGLSSSAACCVLAARAFNRVYDLKLTTRGEMDLAYQGEISTPSQCGRLDQCCAFGTRPVLMRFDGERLDCEELTLGAPLHILIVELNGHKDTVEILQRLNRAYPVAETEGERRVQAFLGPRNKELLEAAIGALAAGDVQQVGALMDAYQADFDAALTPQCPSQLVSPLLHQVMLHSPLRAHVWGVKGIGSQGDGCAQLLCKSAADLTAAVALVGRDFPQMSCLPLFIGSTKPVTQALIPAASFSASLFPASRALTPALFPVIDSDGIMKPAVLILVEEALEAGLTHVVIVVSPHHLSDFRAIFEDGVSPAELARLPPRMRSYSHKIKEMGTRVTLHVQARQLGLGHAVLDARSALKDGEPFVLMLGDHLYRSRHPEQTSCVRQLIERYQGTSLIALRKTHLACVSQFGCATGTWEALPPPDRKAASRAAEVRFNSPTLHVTALAEKPSQHEARAMLATPGLADDEFLCAFGLYLVAETQTLFDALEASMDCGAGSQHNVELTDALDVLRREQGLLGVLLHGERYDIGGSPHSFLDTLNAFAPPRSTGGEQSSQTRDSVRRAQDAERKRKERANKKQAKERVIAREVAAETIASISISQ